MQTKSVNYIDEHKWKFVKVNTQCCKCFKKIVENSRKVMDDK